MSVYFLEAEGRIKIGFSDTVEQRVRTILCAYPKGGKLLGSMPGDRAIERFFHKKFAADRLFGEWFKPSEELLSLIEALTDGTSVEDPKTYRSDTLLVRLEDKFCEDSSDCLNTYLSSSGDLEAGMKAASEWSGIEASRLREIHAGTAATVTSAEYTICRSLGEAAGLPKLEKVDL